MVFDMNLVGENIQMGRCPIAVNAYVKRICRTEERSPGTVTNVFSRCISTDSA